MALSALEAAKIKNGKVIRPRVIQMFGTVKKGKGK